MKSPKQAKCYVQFNLLATQSLKQLSYRLFDYANFMSLNSILARWLFKRLSHNFVQARAGVPYTIKASTIIRDSGLINRDAFRFQLRAIDAALAELKQKRVLYEIGKKRINDGRDRRKIEDVVYQLIPTHEFAQQVIMGNKRLLVLQERAEKDGKARTSFSDAKAVLEISD
ncbi:MAG: hypothetical protein HC930_01530 [Hydrococcus sp. SU_1_0]|nr:hypothetical protein [Hydrococcus sp. SU_1_0]